MKICAWDEGCDSLCEGRTDFCATHNRLRRKMEKDSIVSEQKRKAILSRPKVARKPPKKVSDKRKVENEKYTVLQEAYLLDHPECEIKLLGCEGKSIEVHHVKSRGINLNNVSTFMAACRHCHDKLHFVLSAKEARELGLKK